MSAASTASRTDESRIRATTRAILRSRWRSGRAEQLDLLSRKIARIEHPRPDRVVDDVVDVGDAVDEADDLALERVRLVGPGVVEDPIAHLGGEVEPAAVALEHVDDAQ